MKHIALRARSVRDPRRAFTTTGLGDRIHSVTIGWSYSKAHNTPVTLHLTKSKMEGGQFNNKPESWKEILDLFPSGHVEIAPHNYEPLSENDWIKYLRDKSINADLMWHGDKPGPHETPGTLDVSQYLKNIPKLQPEQQDIELPEKFITVQWDSSDSKRTLKPSQRQHVINQYKNQGYSVVTVGGESSSKELNWSLKHIAYAISKADLHVGVDSAFMHLAFLYKPFNCVHLYNEQDGFFSHHFRRAIDNGIKLNKYHYPIRLPDGTIL